MSNFTYLLECEKKGKTLEYLSKHLSIHINELDCYFANHYRRFYKPKKIKPKMTRDEFIKAWESL